MVPPLHAIVPALDEATKTAGCVIVMFTIVVHEPIVTSKENEPADNPVYPSSSPFASVIVAEPSDKP